VREIVQLARKHGFRVLEFRGSERPTPVVQVEVMGSLARAGRAARVLQR